MRAVRTVSVEVESTVVVGERVTYKVKVRVKVRVRVRVKVRVISSIVNMEI